ncbi:MAG: S8 family serine peptidase [Anaerolineales bacterium]|nr:S8 family serine peptidase [Anaerolineales bacterium]
MTQQSPDDTEHRTGTEHRAGAEQSDGERQGAKATSLERRNTKPLPQMAGDDEAKHGLALRLLSGFATRRGIFALAIASILLLSLSALGVWYITRSSASTEPKINPPLSLSDLAAEYPELATILQDPKLDSAYKEFLLAYQQDGPDAAYEMARKRGLLSADDELRLTLELDVAAEQDSAITTALQQQLEAQGIEVTAASGDLIDIAIPLDVLLQIMEAGDASPFLESITALDHVVRVRIPNTTIRDRGFGLPLQNSKPLKNSGSLQDSERALAGLLAPLPSTSLESLSMIAADEWHAAGYAGQGLKVAVLDGGFDGYRDLLGSDLPANVIVQSFVSGYEVDQMGSVHGTACAEIVYDIAPQAELYLVTAETVAEFRQAVDWLLAQGVDIITHSGGWLYGPKDGNSAPAAVVSKAVSAGVLWVNSSGNYAVNHYRGDFTDDDEDGFHEFSPGDEMMAFEPDGQVQMVLNWDDWEVGDQDFDLFVVDADGNEIVSSENTQSGPGDSAEMIIYDFSDSGPYYIVFYALAVTRPARFDFYIPDTDIEYFTIEYSLNTPGDAASALTVGAVNWEDDKLEYYSSQGPTEEGRLKPEISAPARVDTTVYSKPFFGTSASTPHVAGAAALVWQAYPNLTAKQVADFLIANSIDYGPGGADYGFGYGRLWLGPAPSSAAQAGAQPTATLQAAPPASPTSVAVILPTPAPLQPTAERRPTLTPVGGADDSDDDGIVLMFAACVLLPGLLGLGGIGLLAGVWYLSRSGKPARRKAPRPAPSPRAARQAGVSRPGAPARAGRPGPAQATQEQDLCPRCGEPHRMDAQFCPKCGLSLRWGVPDARPAPVCKNCGRPMRASGKFCPYCGHPR